MRLRIFTDLEARLSRVRLVDDKYIYCRPKRDPDAKLPGVPAINHVGLWNENTARLTQMRPFNPPGIFVEFLPVLWSPLSRGAVRWRYDCEAAFRNGYARADRTPAATRLCALRLIAPSNSP